MKYYRTKLHEDYVNSYDDLDNEELDKEQDAELSKMIEDAGVEVGFKDLLAALESSMKYLNPPGKGEYYPSDPQLDKLWDIDDETTKHFVNIRDRDSFCKTIYNNLVEIHRVVDRKINHPDINDIYKLYNYVASLDTVSLFRSTEDFGISGWRFALEFDECNSHHISVPYSIKLYNSTYKGLYKNYSDLEIYWNEVQNMKAETLATPNTALSDKQLLQALYLRLLIISFSYRAYYKIDYVLNKKFVDEILNHTVDYILYEIKSNVPRPTSNNSKVNEDYVNSYDDLDNEELEKEQDEELSNIIENSSAEVVINELRNLFKDADDYLISQYDKSSSGVRLFCRNLHIQISELSHTLSDDVYSKAKYCIDYNNIGDRMFLLSKRYDSFGMVSYGTLFSFEEYTSRSYFKYKELMNLIKGTEYSDIELFYDELKNIPSEEDKDSSTENPFFKKSSYHTKSITLTDKQLIQAIYLRLLILEYGYKMYYKDHSYISERAIYQILDKTVGSIIKEIKPWIPRPDNHVNEDYISDYDSSNDDLESLDDIIKKSNKDYVIEQLKNICSESRQKTDIRNLFNKLYSYMENIPDATIKIYAHNVNFVSDTIRCVNRIYESLSDALVAYITNKQHNFSGYFDTIHKVIIWTQNVIDREMTTIIHLIHTRGMSKFALLYSKDYLKIISQFTDSIKEELDELENNYLNHVNEDYIESYESDNDDLESLDDIIKRVNEDEAVKQLEELLIKLHNKLGLSTLSKYIDHITPLMRKCGFTETQIKCMSKADPYFLILNRSLRMMGIFCWSVETAISKYKKNMKYSTAQKILEYAQEQFDTEYDAYVSYVSKLPNIKTRWSIEPDINDKWNKLIETYIVNPIQFGLDEIKKLIM